MSLADLIFILTIIRIDATSECEKCSYEGHCFNRLVEMEIKIRKLQDDMTILKETTNGLRKDVSVVNKTVDTVVKPLIAFSAYNPIDTTPERGRIIVFQDVSLNAGGGYNNTFGIFTVPVEGLYHFTAHLCTGMAQFMAFAIHLDGSELARSTIYENTHSSCASVSALTMASTGQKVTVQGTYDGNALLDNIHRRTSFIGFLVQA